MTRDELLKRIDDGRAELNAVLAKVPAGRMLEPALTNGWSVKDMLAHLGAWETRAESLYRSLSSGKDPEDTISDFNVFNAKTYDANREKPLEAFNRRNRQPSSSCEPWRRPRRRPTCLIQSVFPGRAGASLPASSPPILSTIMPSTCRT